MNENKPKLDTATMGILKSIVESSEEWLMGRILMYAKEHGYTAYTSTLKEAWRLSLSGLSNSILDAIRRYAHMPEITPEEKFDEDPVALFGIVEAQRHRERGVSLSMFLGLMKYYRQAYTELVEKEVAGSAVRADCELFVDRVFDRIEIGFCVEWSGGNANKIMHEMQISNMLMTNEKNKYLTIFESIPNPVLILNQGGKIDNMNLAAARLFQKDLLPGSQYYCLSRDRQLEMEQCLDGDEEAIAPDCFGGCHVLELLPWLEGEVEMFRQEGLESMSFEKKVHRNGKTLVFRVNFSQSLDVSDKFAGTIIILEDVTSLKKALEEVKTLRGFVPICSHCKNIRDDKGFWQKMEEYVAERSHAEFSHSICPECAKKYYPDLRIYDD